MSAFPQIRILHFSDLHFGAKHICRPTDPTGSRVGIPSLLSLLQTDLGREYWDEHLWAIQTPEREATPLLIAATGDITETADPGEFDQAHDFFGGLTNGTLLGSKVERRHLFVVPGNHDVAFDRSEPSHRFAPYCSFYNRLFKPIQPDERAFARPDEAIGLSQVHVFPESRLLVAEINSCMYVERETIDESRGHVDQATIASLRKDLQRQSSDAHQWIKIALMHHHPVLLPSFIEPGRGVDAILNAKSLLGMLRESGFQLVLHGHKHFPQIFTYDPEPAWAPADAAIPQTVVAGGSCGSTELPSGTRKCNTYNVLTVKWNPRALQARVQVITRGLIRTGPAGELDPDLWKWETVRVFDKTLSPYETLPRPRSVQRIAFPPLPDSLEDKRDEEYGRLRQNMPVVEVLPSLLPGQGYEARVWLERHRYHRESPRRVVWSAGPKFSRKICDADAAPDFCAYFHYWGPMLIQAELAFEDGAIQVAYVYARLPDTTTRASLDSAGARARLKGPHE